MQHAHEEQKIQYVFKYFSKYLNTDSEEAVELIMWLVMLREEIYGNLFEPVSSIYSALVATIQLGWFPPRGMSIAVLMH